MFLMSQTAVLKPRIIKGGNLQLEIFPHNNGNIDFKNGLRCAIKPKGIVIIRKIIESKANGMYSIETMGQNDALQAGFQNNAFCLNMVTNNQSASFVTQDIVELECFADILRMWPVGLIISDFKQKEKYDNNGNNNFGNQGGNNFNPGGGFNPGGNTPPNPNQGGFNPGGNVNPNPGGGFNPAGNQNPNQDGFNPGGNQNPNPNNQNPNVNPNPNQGGFNPGGNVNPNTGSNTPPNPNPGGNFASELINDINNALQ